MLNKHNNPNTNFFSAQKFAIPSKIKKTTRQNSSKYANNSLSDTKNKNNRNININNNACESDYKPMSTEIEEVQLDVGNFRKIGISSEIGGPGGFVGLRPNHRVMQSQQLTPADTHYQMNKKFTSTSFNYNKISPTIEKVIKQNSFNNTSTNSYSHTRAPTSFHRRHKQMSISVNRNGCSLKSNNSILKNNSFTAANNHKNKNSFINESLSINRNSQNLKKNIVVQINSDQWGENDHDQGNLDNNPNVDDTKGNNISLQSKSVHFYRKSCSNHNKIRKEKRQDKEITTNGKLRYASCNGNYVDQISVNLNTNISTISSKPQKNKDSIPSQDKKLPPQLHQKLIQLQSQYLNNYCSQNYQETALTLIKILNYTIDYNLPILFLKSLKQLSQFHLRTNNIASSLFYFNQTRLGAFILNQPEICVESIIGCSICCRKFQMCTEALVFLKKGLECCWFFGCSELELKVYDQFGKVYYLMGEIQKAMQFHDKFIQALLEPENSPNKTLSKQKMIKWITQSQAKIFEQICPIFLANLSIPVLNFAELPPIPTPQASDYPTQEIRNSFNISTKYLTQIPSPKSLVQKILSQSFYLNEMQQLQPTPRKKTFIKKRKHDFIDFKLKQHLRELGIGTQIKVDLKPSHLEYKEPLEEKVRKKLSQPGLERGWDDKMIREIKRDRKNKLFKVYSQIRVRGKNLPIKPQVQSMRKIFISLYR